MKPFLALPLVVIALTSIAHAEDRRPEIERDLGKQTTVTEVEGFLIAAPPPGDVTGASTIARRAIQAYLNNRFKTRPPEPVLVYLFSSNQPYQAYCKKRWHEPCISIYGFYVGSERRIVLNVGPGVGTLTHELVHPILRADFPEAPTWIDEGLASLYEGFYLGLKNDIYGTKNWRLPRLKQALTSQVDKSDVGLEQLFGLSDETFRDSKEDLHYTMARYFCLWMQTRGWLWDFYQRWRDHVATDPTGKEAFVAVTGRTLAELNADWLQYVRLL
jgi:hypothetical protein